MATHVIEGTSDSLSFNMLLDKDVEICLSDGAIVRADVYRPQAEGKYPLLMTYGPYGKDSHISQRMGARWERLKKRYPEVLTGSSGRYLVFERPNPEQWVPHGYAVVHVDCRGSGRSPGKLDVNSPQEFRDFRDAIEWAGVQPWSNGKVGLLGISYYACGQWMVASLRPKYLAAILPWAGTCDFYRDRTRHEGIFCNGFVHNWWEKNVLENQNGNAASPLTDFVSGARSTGPESFTAEQLAANRVDYVKSVLSHPVLDDWYRERSADLSKIDVPALVVSSWGGLGLHLRGTIEGFIGIASKEKWLKVLDGPYSTTFLAPEGVAVQRRFFDRYLKGISNGWENEPRVEVEVRGTLGNPTRKVFASQWPLPETQWSRLHLDAFTKTLGSNAPKAEAQVGYDAMSEGVMFTSAPLDCDTEIAGSLKAKLQLSSSKSDMDLFCTVLCLDPAGNEITFEANNEAMPLSQGWLRVTQRKLDPVRSSDWQPVHTHEKREPLARGEIVEAEVEIWPTSVFLPKGSRLALVLQGKDYVGNGKPASSTTGRFVHTDPEDRPPELYSGEHTVHTGGGKECYLQVPVIAGR